MEQISITIEYPAASLNIKYANVKYTTHALFLPCPFPPTNNLCLLVIDIKKKGQEQWMGIFVLETSVYMRASTFRLKCA